MKPDLGVRVIKAFDFYRVGDVIFPPGTWRQDLVERQWVERITAEPEPKHKPFKRG